MSREKELEAADQIEEALDLVRRAAAPLDHGATFSPLPVELELLRLDLRTRPVTSAACAGL